MAAPPPSPATREPGDAERRALDHLDTDQLTRDLADLVAIPSVDGTTAEAAAQEWCVDRLASIGLAVDAWDVDLAALAADPAYPGMEVARDRLLGCVGVWGPGDGTPALALCGHTDVVPAGPGDWPGGDPFALTVDDDGRAWGRGACDMKAGVAAIIAATDALARSGALLARPLAVHLVSAEEDGGAGALATLRRGHRADACVIAEPTSGQIIPANAGSLTFRLEVPGLATHGSTRGRGVSAVEKFGVVLAALRRLEQRRNAHPPPDFAHLDLPWPLSVGTVRAGDWASTVPDRLVATGRYGVAVGESLQAAEAAFEQAVATACAADPWLCDHPATVRWTGGRFASGATARADPLVDDVARAVSDTVNRRPGVAGAPYGSDLRHYTAAGIPTVQHGPGDVRFAHAVDEHVLLADAVACARAYLRLALRRCG